MESIQVFQCIFGLQKIEVGHDELYSTCLDDNGNTHVHDIVEHDKCGSFCFCFVSYPNLSNATVSSK